MNSDDTRLPNFSKPPVTEVALGVHFKKLELSSLAMGVLWSECFKEDFPKLEEREPMATHVENFDTLQEARVEATIITGPPPSRAWFLNESGNQLVQLQPDAFVHNWRQLEDENTYPRYPELRDRFERDLRTLAKYLSDHEIGKPEPLQCEVVYVNIIPAIDGVWSRHDEIHKLSTLAKESPPESFLGTLEDLRFRNRYIIEDDDGKAIGRLHIEGAPAFLREDKTPVFKLTLTARGAPREASIEGVMEFLDMGRECVVKSFCAATTELAHSHWGKEK